MKTLIYALIVHFAVYGTYILAATTDNGRHANGWSDNGKRLNGSWANGKKPNGLPQQGTIRHGTAQPPSPGGECGDRTECTGEFFRHLSGKRLGR